MFHRCFGHLHFYLWEVSVHIMSYLIILSELSIYIRYESFSWTCCYLSSQLRSTVILNFNPVQSIFFFFSLWTLVWVLPLRSSKGDIGSSFTFRFLIQLELTFTSNVSQTSHFLHRSPVDLVFLMEKLFFPPLFSTCHSCHKSSTPLFMGLILFSHFHLPKANIILC